MALSAPVSASASSPISQHKAHRIQSQEEGIRPAMSVASQTSNGFSVTVSSVTLPEGAAPGSGGFVALSNDVGGKPDEILGYAKLGERTSKQVKITVADQLNTGDYFFILYSSAKPPQKVGHATKRAKVTIWVS
jgi:hypothetical protein